MFQLYETVTGNRVESLYMVETTLIFSLQDEMIPPGNKVDNAILHIWVPQNFSVNSRLTFIKNNEFISNVSPDELNTHPRLLL